MTPDLKKMVEAIKAELICQSEWHRDRSKGGKDQWGEPIVGDALELEGHFDLEAVARAALGAIREPSEATTLAMHNAARLKDDLHEAYAGVWRGAVDQILKSSGESK